MPRTSVLRGLLLKVLHHFVFCSPAKLVSDTIYVTIIHIHMYQEDEKSVSSRKDPRLPESRSLLRNLISGSVVLTLGVDEAALTTSLALTHIMEFV